MKIFIPRKFKIKTASGPSVFANKFKATAEQLGHQVFFSNPDNYDILFAITHCPQQYLNQAKTKNKPIIHRLGVRYPAVSFLWRLRNIKIKSIYNQATKIIFQSHFNQQACQTFLGIRNIPHQIIYNGVDLNLFSPDGPTKIIRDYPEQKIIISNSKLRHHADRQALASTLNKLKKIRNDFKFIILGKPIINQEGMAQYLRSGDVFLFFERSLCPNSVIEALASGLPISACNRGSAPELVKENFSGLLAPISGLPFGHQTIDTTALAFNTDYILNNLNQFKKNARLEAEQRFDIFGTVQKYLDFFNDPT